MLKAIYIMPDGKPEVVTIIQITQFVDAPAKVVFLRSDGTPSEAEISFFSNVHEELVPVSKRPPTPLTRR